MTLNSDAILNFYIKDGVEGDCMCDNLGGISLNVTVPVVPEPMSSTLLLFIAGGSILGFRRFRKKRIV